jgi:hypothetical protein
MHAPARLLRLRHRQPSLLLRRRETPQLCGARFGRLLLERRLGFADATQPRVAAVKLLRQLVGAPFASVVLVLAPVGLVGAK